MFACLLQGSVTYVQCANGLYNGILVDVELWSGWNDMHTLEGSSSSTTGIPHHDQCSHGSCIHQVPARVDNLGRPGCDIHMG